jgi:hypothetical protein
MRDEIVNTLQGYARANVYLEAERMARLAQLTPEGARAIFADLLASWQRPLVADEESERLERWRIESAVAVRRAFRQIVQTRACQSSTNQ